MDLVRIKELEEKTLNGDASEIELSEYSRLLDEYFIYTSNNQFTDKSQDN